MYIHTCTRVNIDCMQCCNIAFSPLLPTSYEHMSQHRGELGGTKKSTRSVLEKRGTTVNTQRESGIIFTEEPAIDTYIYI